MFCPRCGSTQSDDIRFCKSCGSNIEAVRQAVDSPATIGKFDWKKTWMTEMMQSSEEAVRRAAEIERLQGITPEVKRLNEIKAGVITASVGVGSMILIFVIMNGIILGGRISPGDAELLSRVWIAGIIPFFVGMALIINGVFVTKRVPETADTSHENDNPNRTAVPAAPTTILDGDSTNTYLPPPDTNELFPAAFSVTDETTRHLGEPMQRASATKNDD